MTVTTKRIFSLLRTVLIILILFSVITPSAVLAAFVGDKEISSAGAIVIDFETGLELFAYKADDKRVPASMTKLLAVYVVYDAIARGNIGYDTQVTISKAVSDFSKNREYSNVPFSEGEKVTVDKLLEFVIVHSACAATDALGEAIYGSVKSFVSQMNEKAAQLGIDAVFHDSYGGSADNRISPRGIAVLSRNLIFDHPDILVKTALKSTSHNNVTYENTNKLLGVYSGIDGLKTGYTSAAGYCFAGTAIQNNRRIIAVTMGSSSVQTRFPDMTVLFDYGFITADEILSSIRPSTSTIMVNGVIVTLTVYNINDYHYFKLRDIAFLLGETEKQFEAFWDGDTNAVHLTSGMPYTLIGDELELAPDNLHKYIATTSQIFVNNEECSLDVYNVDDYNYFKLRDIAALIDFYVGWDDETRTVLIDTSMGYGGDLGNEGEDIGGLESGDESLDGDEPGEAEPELGEEPPAEGEVEPGGDVQIPVDGDIVGEIGNESGQEPVNETESGEIEPDEYNAELPLIAA